MRTIWNIARRDMLYQLTQRDFYIATFSIPLLVVVVNLVLRFFGGADGQTQVVQFLTEPASTRIGFVDYADSLHVTDVLTNVTFLEFTEQTAAEQALRAEELDVLFLIPADYQVTGAITRVSVSAGDFRTQDIESLRTILSYNAMQDPRKELIQRLQQPIVDVQTYELNQGLGTGSSIGESLGKGLFALMAAMALYSSIFMGSSLLMNGVIEEKENRTLEVLLTSITPRQLLAGKIIGLGIVGLLQLLIWATISALALNDRFSDLALSVSWQLVTLAVGYFILGFLFYASMMACIGAISPSTRELSQLVLVITIPAIIPVLLLPVLYARPHGLVALGLSFFPWTAPATMMIRATLVDVPAWQIGLSLLILAGSMWLMLSIAARIFRASILLLGNKLSPREFWKALRAS